MDTAEIVKIRILAERAKNRSWREIARDYRLKDHTVIYRIATSDYWPKDAKIVAKLSKAPRPCKSRIPKYGWMIDYPPKTLMQMLAQREPMP